MRVFEEVKSVVNFEDVARNNGIEFDRAGKSCCPFHDEKTPSFHNFGDRGFCFGCGRSADAIDLEAHFANLPSFEAALSLAKKHGVRLPDFTPEDKKKFDFRSEAYALLEQFAKWANQNLKKHPDVIDFLKGKGLEKADIDRWFIGYVGNESPVKNHLKEMELARDIGLINEFGDYFKHRIILPVWDHGKIVFLTGRAFPDSKPKYLHLKNSGLLQSRSPGLRLTRY